MHWLDEGFQNLLVMAGRGESLQRKWVDDTMLLETGNIETVVDFAEGEVRFGDRVFFGRGGVG
jgi:hypothetical protein